jgi:hypothetical protein
MSQSRLSLWQPGRGVPGSAVGNDQPQQRMGPFGGRRFHRTFRGLSDKIARRPHVLASPWSGGLENGPNLNQILTVAPVARVGPPPTGRPTRSQLASRGNRGPVLRPEPRSRCRGRRVRETWVACAGPCRGPRRGANPKPSAAWIGTRGPVLRPEPRSLRVGSAGRTGPEEEARSQPIGSVPVRSGARRQARRAINGPGLTGAVGTTMCGDRVACQPRTLPSSGPPRMFGPDVLDGLLLHSEE